MDPSEPWVRKVLVTVRKHQVLMIMIMILWKSSKKHLVFPCQLNLSLISKCSLKKTHTSLLPLHMNLRLLLKRKMVSLLAHQKGKISLRLSRHQHQITITNKKLICMLRQWTLAARWEEKYEKQRTSWMDKVHQVQHIMRNQTFFQKINKRKEDIHAGKKIRILLHLNYRNFQDQASMKVL